MESTFKLLKVPAIEPWRSVIERTVDDLDAINIMAYDYYWPVVIIIIIIVDYYHPHHQHHHHPHHCNALFLHFRPTTDKSQNLKMKT